MHNPKITVKSHQTHCLSETSEKVHIKQPTTIRTGPPRRPEKHRQHGVPSKKEARAGRFRHCKPSKGGVEAIMDYQPIYGCFLK